MTYPLSFAAVGPGASSAQDPHGLMGRMLGLSVALHAAALVLIATVHLPSKIAVPLSAYQVTLVNLTAPTPAPVTAPRATEAETERVEPVQTRQDVMPEPAPEPVVQVAPKPAPAPLKRAEPPKVEAPPPPAAVKPAPREMTSRSGGQLRDLLRGIELPPDAPKLGDLAGGEVEPAVVPTKPSAAVPAPRKLKKEIDRMLDSLSVPAEPAKPQAAPPPPALAKPIELPSLSKQVQNLQADPLLALAQKKADSSPKTAAKSEAAGKLAPATQIQVAGASSAHAAYLAKVQRLISAQWSAPPLDLDERTYKVVVRFRLDRSGNVSGVVVETPSGNGYYDDAGVRAVLKAAPLPKFTEEISDAFLNVHFGFIVGEPVG